MVIKASIIKKDVLSRNIKIKINEKQFMTPTIFPSVSSYGLKLHISKLTEIINNFEFPRVLISSYDMSKKEYETFYKFLKNYIVKNILFLDSGCYESYWFSDKTWNIESYKNVLQKSSPDIYASYDFFPDKYYTNIDYLYKKTLENILLSKKNLNNKLFLPIFHSRRIEHMFKVIDMYLYDYSNETKSIGLSERELGYDILSIVINIKKIRKIINKYDENIILHILGCGDPLSILLYTYVGADTFDSRDWAKRVFHRNNLLRYPLSFLNILSCDCNICSDFKGDYIDKVLLHNLLFYENFFNTIQEWINNQNLIDNLSYYFDADFLSNIEKF